MFYVMPFTGRRKCIGFPHLLSLRNVAHSANDGTAVYFFRIDACESYVASFCCKLCADFVVGFGIDGEEVCLGSDSPEITCGPGTRVAWG